MTKIQCYIAQSIDGYIARKDHSIDWLENISVPEGSDMGYSDFYAGIDTVIMGRKTYDEVMGFDVPWPYADAKSFVVTSDKDHKIHTPNTELVHRVDDQFITHLKANSKSNIWLIGGGGLVTQFMKLHALDELIITIIPIVLGGGIPLFPSESPETQFDLIKVSDFGNGAVALHYVKK